MAEASPVGCDNSGTVPLRVPGIGLALDWDGEKVSVWDGDEAFRHGANDFRPMRMTVREVAMVRFMEAVTEKADWHRKVLDDAIVQKWRAEAAEATDGLLSDAAFEWCLAELRDRAADYESDGLVRTLEAGSRVVKSDTVVSPSLRDELLHGVKPLLQGDAVEKDWHPGSDEQVLNLVHPSLYPLVYDRTRVLNTGQVGLLNCMDSTGMGDVALGSGKLKPGAAGRYRARLAEDFWSGRFQWLPAEVGFVGTSGTGVKFNSYINNLHPVTHRGLYSTVEKLISVAIPAWNEVLIKGYDGRNSRRIAVDGAETDPPELPDWHYSWNDDDETNHAELMEKLRDYLRLPDNPDRDIDSGDEVELPDDWETTPLSDWPDPENEEYFYEGWNLGDAVRWKYARIRKVLIPEPGKAPTYEEWARGGNDQFRPRDVYKIRLEEEFRQQGLQVIVKLASIELTPEKPSYPGGGWHIEGMLNEHIVATAIYYYDVANCTASRLNFRQEADLDEVELRYEQEDHGPLIKIFGTSSMRDEQAVQDVGGVETREGRLLAFPNTLQHKVEPFELADQTKPGHRRFVVLWLVDPRYRVASTRNVPPQQEDWWAQHIRADDWERDLPQEIKDEILGHAQEGMMTLEEAKALRLELMAERTTFVSSVEQGIETYNLCEH